jgi:hypothetical protein
MDLQGSPLLDSVSHMENCFQVAIPSLLNLEKSTFKLEKRKYIKVKWISNGKLSLETGAHVTLSNKLAANEITQCSCES